MTHSTNPEDQMRTATRTPEQGGPVRAAGILLATPTDEDIRFALERYFGREAADDLWWEACTALGLPHDRRPLALAEMERVAEYLEWQPGEARIVGRAMRLRLWTYTRLRERRRAEAAVGDAAGARGGSAVRGRAPDAARTAPRASDTPAG